MSNEQKYRFVDLTGECFEKFQAYAPYGESPDAYYDTIGAFMRAGREFGVGDMMVFKRDLIDAGFEWGKDFVVRRV